jgi:superfamily II DNA or RNA helicase
MPRGIYNNVKCVFKKDTQFQPTPHQKATMEYFLKSPYKGLLLYHKLGSGKTCTAILIADAMLDRKMVDKVYVLTPGSLRQGWINEYGKTCGQNPENLAKFVFVTYNYSVTEVPSLENSLVIIDEVHNLVNGAKNLSKYPSIIYDAVLNAKCRVLALSGTPIYNYIYEFALLGNLLKPGEFPEIRRKESLDTEAFLKYFNISKEGNVEARNPTEFGNMLKGIISFYAGTEADSMPEIIMQEPIQVVMSRDQELAYWMAEEQENKLQFPPSKRLLHENPALYNLLSKLYVVAKKKILTRKISNFSYPPGIVTSPIENEDEDYEENAFKNIEKPPKPDQEIYEEIQEEKQAFVSRKDFVKSEGGWIDCEFFDERQLFLNYSPKIGALITNILLHDSQKHVVFTFFKNRSGAYLIYSILKMCGISAGVFSGDLDDSRRTSLLKKFNSPDNDYGDDMRVLIVTEAGAEGISILTARHMHILESSPRMSKTIQAIGRVARLRSHERLKSDEKNVKVWKYWSVGSARPIQISGSYINNEGKTVEYNKVIADKTTVDTILYEKGMVTLRQIDSFQRILQYASITK